MYGWNMDWSWVHVWLECWVWAFIWMAFAVRAAIEYDHELLEARTQVCPRTLFIEHWDETSDLVPEGEEK
jgi:hypothetical protein